MLWFALALVFLAIVYGIFIEPNTLIKTELNLNFEGLQKPLKIIQISDLHATKISRPFIKALKAIEKECPDFVFITGDFVGYNRHLLCKDYLAEIAKACPNTYAILGNWDHKAKNFKRLVQEIQETGIKLLINEHIGAKGIFIAGVDDPYREMDNLPKTFKNIPKNGFVILLAHSPDIIYKALPYKPKLILSGHLHGGQVALPFIKFAIYSPSRYWVKFLKGLYKIEQTYLYVNRGIGESHLRIRICSPPEVAIINLKSADNL